MSITPVGHCFVSREEWPEYCRISTDIPVGSDYDTFANAVQKFGDEVVARGGRFIKIGVKPADILSWCQARGRQIDASARADYAAARLLDLDK